MLTLIIKRQSDSFESIFLKNNFIEESINWERLLSTSNAQSIYDKNNI